ncbi:MAG: peptide-methionine (S)-S-oxide reductase MsrA [Rickettsiales bacterium]|nr:peptide-methionine (S)-S-oxide reductase MsrA [Rickettsiales bacterium]
MFALLFSLLFSHAHAAEEASAEPKRAIFAGGCFWCMESEFEGTLGVMSVTSGYTGGSIERPSYKDVSAGSTGHAEAVEVVYDPAKVSYKQLLDIYWSNIDPVDAGGQFADRGSQYRTEIFYTDEEQHKLAQDSKRARQAKLAQELATAITPAGVFWPAEEYHQDYAKKNPVHYNAYKYGSGRVNRLKELGNKE